MSNWKRVKAEQLRRDRKRAERRKAELDKQIRNLTEEARQRILTAPPGFVEEMTLRLKEQEDELKQLEADPAATPEAKTAKAAEVAEAKRTLAFVQETLLSLLPRPIDD